MTRQQFDSFTVSSARRYNYWLGGKDHFAPDRESGDAIEHAFPEVVSAARENRRFVERVVDWLAEHGVRQFVDVGCGLPVQPYVHEIAAKWDPNVTVVYVDNDELVMCHARALMDLPDATAYVDGDLAHPDTILPALAMLDPDQPAALLLAAVVHFLEDPGVIRPLVDRLPPGSYVALSHATEDFATAEERDQVAGLRTGGHGGFWPRSLDELAELLAGLRPCEPGIVPITDWHPEREPQPKTRRVRDAAGYAVLATKP